jgi:hypothetical protein
MAIITRLNSLQEREFLILVLLVVIQLAIVRVITDECNYFDSQGIPGCQNER